LKILYLSYDGMTDPLGRSQVLPYLCGLSAKGYQISIISFEKPTAFKKYEEDVKKIITDNNLIWIPQKYTPKPPVLSTLYDIHVLKKAARKLYKKEGFEIVHCRSYITALAGLWLKRKCHVKFIFDMRGFWADERVDGMIWNRSNTVFNTVYKYFKKKEKQYLSGSSAVISLTNAGKYEIESWNISPKPAISVIPCCADLEFFHRQNIPKEKIELLRKKLGIKDSDYVVSYLGSIGTWYMLDEMLDFFKELLAQKSNALFLFISGEDPLFIQKKTEAKGIPLDRIKVVSAKREEVPEMILLSRFSLFFILPVFSKKASSPTKMGEIMGMGIPVICNSNVGDCDMIINETKAGLLVEELNPEGYRNTIEKLKILENLNPEHIRQGALKYFSLSDGVEKYAEIYRDLEEDNL
jgi:glycosyltransferase involved in cell wall biosynthesis